MLWRWSAAFTAVLVCGGCTGVPFTPGPWFEPSPTPPAREAAPSPVVSYADPDVQFDGVLKTVDGLTATFSTRLHFGQVTTSPQLSTGRLAGWVSVVLPLTGEVSVTNTGTRPNPAAASVVVEYSVGYPATSRVCELMSDPEMPDRSVAGGFCWRSAGTATFSYGSGPPFSIQPGAGFGTNIGDHLNEVGVSVDTPAAEVDDIAGLMSRPAVIVATTNDIPGLGTSFQFAGACMDPVHTPTAPSGPSPSMVSTGEQHAIIGATRYLTCSDLPDLGN